MQRDETLITEIDQRRLQSYLREAVSSDTLIIQRLAALGGRLARSRIVGSRNVPSNVVTMNSLVVLRNLNSGNRMICRLAYPHQARQSAHNVCVLRPLGTALLGKRVGEIIRWPSGGRDRRMRIQQVLYQPEAAGDLHL